ncbi:MAG: hypothetical protein AB1760_15845 [Pseudomonadota bacterium]
MRKPAAALLTVLTAALLAAAPLAAAGCQEEPTTTGADAFNSSAARVSTATNPATDATGGAVTTPAATVEEQSPYAAVTDPEQTAGELIDGLRLDDIRWGDHGAYFRIVFDISTTGGEAVTQAPHADASLSADGRTVSIILGGMRGIGDQPNAQAASMPVGHPLVTSITKVPAFDDQALIYDIELAAPATYSLASLGSPGRVIIDITPAA